MHEGDMQSDAAERHIIFDYSSMAIRQDVGSLARQRIQAGGIAALLTTIFFAGKFDILLAVGVVQSLRDTGRIQAGADLLPVSVQSIFAGKC